MPFNGAVLGVVSACGVGFSERVVPLPLLGCATVGVLDYEFVRDALRGGFSATAFYPFLACTVLGCYFCCGTGVGVGVSAFGSTASSAF